jgi:hypothetical protein
VCHFYVAVVFADWISRCLLLANEVLPRWDDVEGRSDRRGIVLAYISRT